MGGPKCSQRIVMSCLSLALAVGLALGPLLVAGHGNMVWPPTWFDRDGKDGLRPGGVGKGENLPMMWFSNWTFIPEEHGPPLILCSSPFPISTAMPSQYGIGPIAS